MNTWLSRLWGQATKLSTHRAFPLMGGSTAFLLYLILACFVLQPQAVWSPDEGAKLLQLKALHFDQGHLNLAIIYTSQGMDPNFEYALINPPRDLLTVQGDALMLPRLPIFTLLVWPFYTLFGLVGLYILPALAGGTTVGLTLTLLPASERRLSMWILVALGSPILIYSTIFWEHTLATALCLAASWLILGRVEQMERTARWEPWIVSAALFALGTYLRLETAIYTLAFLAAVLLRFSASWRRVSLAAITYLALLLPYSLLHQALFQAQTLPLNARYLNLPLAYLGHARWSALQDLLIGPFTDEAIQPGWVGFAWTALALLSLALSWLAQAWPRLRPWLWAALAASLLPAAYFLFTSTAYRSAHGLLFTTPWALLGLCRLPHLWSDKNLRLQTLCLTLAAGLGGYTLAMLVFRGSSPHGGLEWGARFALSFYPLLVLASCWHRQDVHNNGSVEKGWAGVQRKFISLLLTAFILLGIAFHVRGVITIRNDKLTSHALNLALLATPKVQVLSDLWWLPLNAAPIYPQKAFFLANTPEQMAAWLGRAGDAHFRDLSLVTLNPELPAQVSKLLTSYQVQITDQAVIENLYHYQLSLLPR